MLKPAATKVGSNRRDIVALTLLPPRRLHRRFTADIVGDIDETNDPPRLLADETVRGY